MKIEISCNTTLDSHYKQFLKSKNIILFHLILILNQNLDKFMNLCIIDSLFARLQSLVLNSISTYKLLIVLFYLKSLPYLSSLSICLNNCFYDLGHICQMIFHLFLKYFRVAVLRHPRLCITIPIVAQNIDFLIYIVSTLLNQMIISNQN